MQHSRKHVARHITVLFVAAYAHELACIKTQIQKLTLQNLQSKFFLLWAWNYKAIYNLKNFIDVSETKPDFVVNLWICGKKEHVSDDAFQVYRILLRSAYKEYLCPIYINYWVKKSLVCSETIVTNESNMLWEDYVDMESFTIDFVCTAEALPYIILKQPYDNVSENSMKLKAKDMQDCLTQFDYAKLMREIEVFLEKNQNPHKTLWEIDLENTLEIYTFTHAETQIWKKNYNKLIAYKIDYWDFFNTNKSRTKKEFLQLLQNI